MLTILASKFQLVQDDMSKARSVRKDWEFVSKGTEISLGRFVSEFFTPLTLDSNTGVISDEDTVETRWVGGQQGNEENPPPRIQEDR